MICVNCSQGSLGSFCPFCNTPDVQRVLGFDPLDLINPYQAGKDIASSFQSSSSSSSDGPSLLDRLPSPNPFSAAYDAGHAAVDQAKQVIGDAKASALSPFTRISHEAEDFLGTLKWIFYGGIAIGAGVFVYSVYQAWKHDIPGTALRSMSESQREGRKIAGDVLRKAV